MPELAQELAPLISEKRWDPSLEAGVFKRWEEGGIYSFNPKIADKPIWSIDTPPPYCSGAWHMGGALHYSSIDIIARYKRMMGFNVNFPMGVDRNGLPIEVQAEKEYGVRMNSTPRQEFLDLCRELLDKYEKQILQICAALGFSMNSLTPSGIYRTDSPEYRKLTQATFIELWNKGLIYEDDRPNNWCTSCGTTIADAEIEYRDDTTKLSYLKFTVKESGDVLEIATTRPELLCACAAVLVHPDDARYKHLHDGTKHAIVPIFGKEVPIITNPAAQMEFGTGVVMICSYGDYTDVRLFRDLGLKPTAAITADGRMSDAAGINYAGLKVVAAREKVLEDLNSGEFVTRTEILAHRTPICWRSKTPIEFIHMKEYYLKQVQFVEDLIRIADEINFHPPQSKQILLDWAKSVNLDWPISRRRFYGTEIPLWYCRKCREPILPPPGKYYRPWMEPPPIKSCHKCGCTEFEGEKRTFDTWMDSSISELFITGYIRDDALFGKAFPCSIRPQGKDIVRTWLYYTLLRSYQLFGKRAFDHVWISGHVVDEHGEKMSKSVGNVVAPEPVIKEFGSDSLRFLACTEATLGNDIRFSKERLKGASRFVQKLFNVSRFISSFPQLKEPPKRLEPADRWILAELDRTVREAKAGYESLDFFVPANAVKGFVWDVFADHYIELVKPRAYNRNGTFTKEEQESAFFALHEVMRTCLKLLAPIVPFVTDYVWTSVYSETGGSIHLEDFPQDLHRDEGVSGAEITAALKELNGRVWNSKKTAGLSMRAEFAGTLEIPAVMQDFAADVCEMHNAKKESVKII